VFTNNSSPDVKRRVDIDKDKDKNQPQNDQLQNQAVNNKNNKTPDKMKPNSPTKNLNIGNTPMTSQRSLTGQRNTDFTPNPMQTPSEVNRTPKEST
jgi:hypothetical protein